MLLLNQVPPIDNFEGMELLNLDLQHNQGKFKEEIG
jgi:hypothetical protein